MLHSNRSIMKCSLLTIFIALLLFIHGAVSAEEEKEAQTVAVLPFEMHAPDSLAYLQDGLRDMLASRLAANGGAQIMEHGKVDALLKEPGKILQQKEAVELARQLAVDYVVTGSLTSLGGSMSLDAKVFTQEDAAPSSFYASAAQENEVIAAVNSLSWDIAEKFLGAKRPASAMQHSGTQPAPVAQDPDIASFRTEHPDTKYQFQGYVHGTRTSSPTIMNGFRPQAFLKTQHLEMSLQGSDAGFFFQIP